MIFNSIEKQLDYSNRHQYNTSVRLSSNGYTCDKKEPYPNFYKTPILSSSAYHSNAQTKIGKINSNIQEKTSLFLRTHKVDSKWSSKYSDYHRQRSADQYSQASSYGRVKSLGEDSPTQQNLYHRQPFEIKTKLKESGFNENNLEHTNIISQTKLDSSEQPTATFQHIRDNLYSERDEEKWGKIEGRISSRVSGNRQQNRQGNKQGNKQGNRLGNRQQNREGIMSPLDFRHQQFESMNDGKIWSLALLGAGIILIILQILR